MAFVITTIGYIIYSLPPLCKVNLAKHKNRYDEHCYPPQALLNNLKRI
jgi:hypothetical protein